MYNILQSNGTKMLRY